MSVCWHIEGSFTKDGISHAALTPRPPACVNKERPNFGPFETWRWWFSSIQLLQVARILMLPRQCWKFATEWHHRNSFHCICAVQSWCQDKLSGETDWVRASVTRRKYLPYVALPLTNTGRPLFSWPQNYCLYFADNSKWEWSDYLLLQTQKALIQWGKKTLDSSKSRTLSTK